MDYLFDLLKSIILGIVEGITEFLPISSTGHLILVDEFIQLNVSEAFSSMYTYVIQLGAILAVVLIFWNKMWPFKKSATSSKIVVRKETISTWLKVVVACIPGVLAELLLGDFVEAKLSAPVNVALALIIYGIIFIVIEIRNKGRKPRVEKMSDLTYRDALLIGLFQCLSIVPGTSRSGSTIIGALLIGISRVAAAEFTFFLAVPVMFGMSFLKLVKYGLAFSLGEIGILLVGFVAAFVVALLVVRMLMSYIKKHDFRIFGWYRIILGVLVLVYFTFLR